MSRQRIDEDRLLDLQHKEKLSEVELKELGAMSSVQELDFWPGAKFAAGALRHIGKLGRLRALSLVESNIKDADLAAIGKIKSLKQLTLDDCPVGDAGLKHLAGLANLEELELSGTKITDKGLAHLGKLKRLEWLCLSGTKVTDAGLAHLAGLSGLDRLDLDETKVTNAGLRHLGGLKRLERLDLHKTKVTKEGLAWLSGLPKFEKIAAGFKEWKVSKRELQEMRCAQILKQTAFTRAEMEEIAGLGFAGSLDFKKKSKFGPGVFGPLKKLKYLKSVHIDGSKITDSEVADLAECKNLIRVAVNGCSVTDAGVRHLTNLPRLEDLWLEGTKITDKGLVHIGKIITLKYLYLNQTRITDKGLAHLRDLSGLSVLGVSKTKVTNEGILTLAGLRKLTIVAKGTKVTRKGMDDYVKAQREARRASKAKGKAAAAIGTDAKEIEAAKAVLYCFFAAMNKWEGKMKRRPKTRASAKAFMDKQRKALATIYEEFVVQRKRPWGRLACAHWSEPPTYYKPEKMKIIDAEQPTARKIIFYTNKWPQGFRQQFVLMQKADKWHIDNRKVFLDGWEAESL